MRLFHANTINTFICSSFFSFVSRLLYNLINGIVLFRNTEKGHVINSFVPLLQEGCLAYVYQILCVCVHYFFLVLFLLLFVVDLPLVNFQKKSKVKERNLTNSNSHTMNRRRKKKRTRSKTYIFILIPFIQHSIRNYSFRSNISIIGSSFQFQFLY